MRKRRALRTNDLQAGTVYGSEFWKAFPLRGSFVKRTVLHAHASLCQQAYLGLLGNACYMYFAQ